MPTLEASPVMDFQSETYKDAYSRINAIVIEGELEAMKGFQACAKNLSVTPDMPFAKEFFSNLHENFQVALAEDKIVTCLLIQSLIIETFAIAAYNIYIPVADDFARKITEGVVKDEYMHLNFGEEWLKANFESAREELEEANRANLPLVWKMLNEVEKDAAVLGMEKDALVEDFMITYGEALANIGFSARDVMKLSAQGLAAA